MVSGSAPGVKNTDTRAPPEPPASAPRGLDATWSQVLRMPITTRMTKAATSRIQLLFFGSVPGSLCCDIEGNLPVVFLSPGASSHRVSRG